jgi:hypothetical protein
VETAVGVGCARWVAVRSDNGFARGETEVSSRNPFRPRVVEGENPALSRRSDREHGSPNALVFRLEDNLAYGFLGQGMGWDPPGIPVYQRRHERDEVVEEIRPTMEKTIEVFDDGEDKDKKYFSFHFSFLFLF